jgi:long-subunit acyl-CoA synthetase (AMP-forming)
VRGQTGEFWLRSPAITPGYWEKPDETKKHFPKDGLELVIWDM